MMDNGGLNEKGKPELKVGEGGQGETKKGEKRTDSGALFRVYFTSTSARTHKLTHTNTHTHRGEYTLAVWCWGVFVCWVTPRLSAAGVIYPCLYGPPIRRVKSTDGLVSKSLTCLFQHQKVHLGASVIFHPFPQLSLSYIMMSNSLVLSLSLSLFLSVCLSLILSPAARLSSSPPPLPLSASVSTVSHTTPKLLLH